MQKGVPGEEARRILTDDYGDPNAAACLTTLLDPGEDGVPGATIIGCEVN